MKNELCETLVFNKKKKLFYCFSAVSPMAGIDSAPPDLRNCNYLFFLLITNFRFWPQFFVFVGLSLIVDFIDFFVCPFFLKKKKFRRLGETRGIKFPGFRVDSNFARNRPGGRGARYTEKVGTWVSSAGYRQQIGSSYPSFPLILEFFSSFIYFNYFKSF